LPFGVQQSHNQPQLLRGSTPQSPAAGATDGMLLLRGLEMTRATAEITRQVCLTACLRFLHIETII
jgi:hypothetical protein